MTRRKAGRLGTPLMQPGFAKRIVGFASRRRTPNYDMIDESHLEISGCFRQTADDCCVRLGWRWIDGNPFLIRHFTPRRCKREQRIVGVEIRVDVLLHKLRDHLHGPGNVERGGAREVSERLAIDLQLPPSEHDWDAGSYDVVVEFTALPKAFVGGNAIVSPRSANVGGPE